ncbi:hypothetical protein BG004_006421 [Podila humilis]|nr:hypothetical protein BG004_006421 [Podila humilis]
MTMDSSFRGYSTVSQKFSRWIAKMSTTASRFQASSASQNNNNNILPPVKSTAELDMELHAIPQVQHYHDLVNNQGTWTRGDPHDFAVKEHHLTAGALRGERMLNMTPIKFTSLDKKQVVVFYHLGRSLCGHDKVIHGGLIASILDEVTWMAAVPSMPGHAGFTANLNVNYRKRISAEQIVMVKGEFTQVEGRKGWSKATVCDLAGTVLADATALFVSPFGTKAASG